MQEIPEFHFIYIVRKGNFELYEQSNKLVIKLSSNGNLENIARKAVDSVLKKIPFSKVVIKNQQGELLLDYIRIRKSPC